MSVIRIALLVSFVTLVIQNNHYASSIRVLVNQTNDGGNGEETVALEDTEAKLSDRYRRLIPYMTYYVINNYVRAPHQQQQQQQQQQQDSQQLRNSRYQKPTTQNDQFVPSVQYDPKGIESDDVFLPLRYRDKNTYEDYASIRTPKPISIVQSTIPETRYHHTTSHPEYTKLIPAKIQQDYPNYDEEFESVRYVPQLPKARPTPVRYPSHPELTPLRLNLNHVLKSIQLTNELPEVLSKDNIDNSIKTLVEILNILNGDKKGSYTPEYETFKAAVTKPKVITESNYEATQFSRAPHNELVEIKTPRPYVKPVKIPIAIPHEDFVDDKPLNPYVGQIKSPQSVSDKGFIGQIDTTRPYLHPIKGFTTPIPTEDLIEIKPVSPYVKQITAPPPIPNDELINIKPYISYVKQVKPQVSIPNEDLIDIKPYLHQTENSPTNHYTKSPVSIRYEDLIEVKQPMNIFLGPSEIHRENLIKHKPQFEQPTTPMNEIDETPYVQPTETRTPMPPTQDTQKNIQYYVPIVQDIDEEKVTYKPANKEPAMSPTIEHTSPNNYIHHDSMLEDENLTLPADTEEPPQITEPTIPPVLKYGATRGKPHVDYPAYTEIPETDFSCKQQRYKGFFGDPQTGCQVWHYCDLNGGKSSFLCPNGTIFNQVALTCDWWFNVKCESTTQLYVLNERLYKYILPVMPKFPEDFTGPEVDKYLELKFKEMEAKMMMDKKKKKEQQQEEKDKSPINTLQSIEDSKKR